MSPRSGWSFALLLCLIPALPAGAADPKVAPEKVKAAVAELDKLAEQTLKRTGVPGIAIAIVHHDKVVFLKGYGVREAGKNEPIDADTVFQLASVSKPITTTVLARLVGKKQIDWDDRVIDHDPGFRLFDPWVTRELRLRDLLCHRSGLPDHGGDLLEDLGFSRDEILHRLRYQKSGGKFRADYAYTNFGFTEAAVAAARAVGKPWEEVADEMLFRAIGMKSTSARHADFAKTANRARLHVPVEGKWVAKYDRQPDAQAPAGGVSSTARDMTRYMRLLLADGKFEGEQLVAKEALAETFKPHMFTGMDVKTGHLSSYGLGWGVIVSRGGRIFYKHSGGFGLGARTEVALLPADDIGITVLSNAGPTGIPEALTESFFDLLLDGKVERDWVEFANRMYAEEMKRELGKETDYSKPPAKPSPALAHAAYAGQYHNDFFGTIEVAEKGGAPEVRLGPKKQAFPLRHWDRDVFIYHPTGENAGGPSGLIFKIGPQGTALSVLIENLNIHDEGTFIRVQPEKK
jgi:CubicO group peptidase (beta-lactamase class C family)